MKAAKSLHRGHRLADDRELVGIVLLEPVGAGGDRGRRGRRLGARFQDERVEACPPGRERGRGADHAGADDHELGRLPHGTMSAFTTVCAATSSSACWASSSAYSRVIRSVHGNAVTGHHLDRAVDVADVAAPAAADRRGASG